MGKEGVEDDDPSSGVKKESNRSAATRPETEAEEWWASGCCDDVSMGEGSTVVRGTMDLEQGAVGADYKRSLAQHWNKTGEDIFGFCEDNDGVKFFLASLVADGRNNPGFCGRQSLGLQCVGEMVCALQNERKKGPWMRGKGRISWAPRGRMLE